MAEGDTGTRPATFTVSLSEASGSQVTADWATADGTATAGSDYTADHGTVTFAAGETTKTITVDVIGDRTFEPDETFKVNLSNASGAPISRGTGTGTIVNDDPQRVAPDAVRFGVTSRDRTAPYRYKVSGRVVRPSSVARVDACTGNVRIRYISGGHSARDDLAGLDSHCRFKLTTVFDTRHGISHGRLTVRVDFQGNRFLLPKSASSRTVRAG